MKIRVFAAALLLCFTVCALYLSSCTQKDTPGSNSSNPVETHQETTPAASAPIEEPPDGEGENFSGDEVINLSTENVAVYRISTNIEYSFDLDGDGVLDTLELHNNDPQMSCEVLFNGEKINSGDEWSWISQAHLICRLDKSVALIYQQDGAAGYSGTSIYTFAEGKANKTERLDNAYTFISYDKLLLTEPVFYFLGNQFVSIEATFNEDFTLELSNDGWFSVITEFNLEYGWGKYFAKEDIQMLRLENEEYVKATMPAGTRVYPQFIDESQTRMIMKAGDGVLWMYTRDSAGLHFEEGDLFEGCIFAGP